MSLAATKDAESGGGDCGEGLNQFHFVSELMSNTKLNFLAHTDTDIVRCPQSDKFVATSIVAPSAYITPLWLCAQLLWHCGNNSFLSTIDDITPAIDDFNATYNSVCP